MSRRRVAFETPARRLICAIVRGDLVNKEIVENAPELSERDEVALQGARAERRSTRRPFDNSLFPGMAMLAVKPEMLSLR